MALAEEGLRPAVAARDLSLIFQTADTPVTALTGVNLDIARGEFVSFIGPSGCGKTTLMRVIADLEQPTGGSILVNGVSPQAARQARAYGYVFQAAALYPWRNVLRNVMLPLEIIGLPLPNGRNGPGSSWPWSGCKASRRNTLGSCRAACSSVCRLRARWRCSPSCC